MFLSRILHGAELQCKVELGLVIGKRGRDISEANALSHIAGYGAWTLLCRCVKIDEHSMAALAVDMTARNLQDEVKKKGLPWSAVKGFDTFTPIGCVHFHSFFTLFMNVTSARSFPSRRSPTRIVSASR
jgi:hypothetical protein